MAVANQVITSGNAVHAGDRRGVFRVSGHCGSSGRAPLIDPSPLAARNCLVGRCPLVVVQVNGTEVQCLLDTGSQVTLFSESLSRELFGVQGHSAADAPWLTLRGANGLDIPYVDYLVTDLKVHGTLVPRKGVVIVRDTCLGAHRALLGMNVITDCWEELFKARPTPSAPREEKREWDRILADCRQVRMADAQRNRESVGRVMWVATYCRSRPRARPLSGPAFLPSFTGPRNGSWWSLTQTARLWKWPGDWLLSAGVGLP